MNKIIGIIGAIDEEIEKLLEQTEVSSTETMAKMVFHKGNLGGADVVIVKSGMGKVNTAICSQILISQYNVSLIINTGFAGALSPEVTIGNIVVSTEVVQHDFDVSPLGSPKGEILSGLVALPTDKDIVNSACKVIKETLPDVRVFSGRICSGDQFISGKAAKERIINDFGGLCCEMEGAAVGQTCYLNNIPFLVIRAVSDAADEAAGWDFNFSVFQSSVADEFAKAIIKLLENI